MSTPKVAVVINVNLAVSVDGGPYVPATRLHGDQWMVQLSDGSHLILTGSTPTVQIQHMTRTEGS